jgi:hypothetical protein
MQNHKADINKKPDVVKDTRSRSNAKRLLVGQAADTAAAAVHVALAVPLVIQRQAVSTQVKRWITLKTTLNKNRKKRERNTGSK